MSFNQVETIFLADAIKDLNKEFRKYKEYKDYFRNGEIYLGNGVHFVELFDGRLTAHLPRTNKIDERLEPVEYKGRIPKAPDTASAVRIYTGI